MCLVYDYLVLSALTYHTHQSVNVCLCAVRYSYGTIEAWAWRFRGCRAPKMNSSHILIFLLVLSRIYAQKKSVETRKCRIS